MLISITDNIVAAVKGVRSHQGYDLMMIPGLHIVIPSKDVI